MMEPRFMISLGEVPAGAARIPLLQLGRWVKGRLKFAITQMDLADIIRNFRKRKNGEVVIDYEHASESPEVARGDPIPAAGWLKSIEDKPDQHGVVWGLAEFTERARGLITGKEYKYISPAISWGVRDKDTGEQQGTTLTSVALVNRPFIEALPAIQLSEAGWSKETERNNPMKTSIKLAEGGETLVVCCGECGRETLADALPKVRVLGLSEIPRDRDGLLSFSAIEKSEAPVAPEVIRAMVACREVQAAMQKGIITPAQRPHFERIALSDLETFRSIVKTMKPQVDLSECGLSSGGEELTGEHTSRVLEHLAQHKMTGNPKLSFGEALRLVCDERPDLARQRAQMERVR